MQITPQSCKKEYFYVPVWESDFTGPYNKTANQEIHLRVFIMCNDILNCRLEWLKKNKSLEVHVQNCRSECAVSRSTDAFYWDQGHDREVYSKLIFILKKNSKKKGNTWLSTVQAGSSNTTNKARQAYTAQSYKILEVGDTFQAHKETPT